MSLVQIVTAEQFHRNLMAAGDQVVLSLAAAHPASLTTDQVAADTGLDVDVVKWLLPTLRQQGRVSGMFIAAGYWTAPGFGTPTTTTPATTGQADIIPT